MGIRSVSEAVFNILCMNEAARNSDKVLYCQIIEQIEPGASHKPFWMVMECPDFPGFETVRRARQKIQASYKELRSTDDVQAAKELREKEFEEYAKGWA